MNAEKDLNILLSSMSPELLPELYVFCNVPLTTNTDVFFSKALATFKEEEGLTLVMKKAAADDLHLDYSDPFRCIILRVHSSLLAVGLTAAVANALTERGISANVIAAFYHDYIFVPEQRALEALEILTTLTQQNKISH